MVGGWLFYIAAVLSIASIPSWAFTFSPVKMSVTGQKPKLYDIPRSHHGARCRFIIYEKGIEDQVDIVTPAVIGGIKSREYLKLNCHGKMPLLVTEDCGPIPESRVICEYLIDKFQDQGYSFRSATLESRIKAVAIYRLYDTYIAPIQVSMYKPAPPYGVHSDRLAAIKDLETQLGNLENLASGEGPYLAGAEVSEADAAIWPSIIFIRYIMPKFDKQESGFLGPKLTAWCHYMEGHPTGKRIMDEIVKALEIWDAEGRWDTIQHAGKRDTKDSTIFDKIIAKEIPSTVVFEDDQVLAFRDVKPVAPTHVLIVPKRRDGLTQLRYATADQAGVLGHMLEVAARIATQEELEGFRLQINDGARGGQEVFHLHMHLTGAKVGEDLSLPRL